MAISLNTVNSLYQKYFGRNANSAEGNFWTTQSSGTLETQLKNDYTAIAGHGYDKSPIRPGNTKTDNDLKSSSASSPSVDRVPNWSLSSWRMNDDSSWKQQPVLTINGQSFRFNTPKEYFDKLNEIKSLGASGDINTIINQMQKGVDYYNIMEDRKKKTGTRNEEIAELYSNYFGRDPSADEYAFWSTQTSEVLRQQLNKDYKTAAGHDYDGSPVLAGNEYSTKDKARIDALFNKYGYTSSQADYNYWSNSNKTNNTGNLETNLQERRRKDPSISTTEDKNIYRRDKDLYVKKGEQYYKIPNPEELYNLVNNQGYQDTRLELPADVDTEKTTADISEPEEPTDVTTIDPDEYDRAFFMDSEKGAFVQFEGDPDGAGPLTKNTLWYVDPTTKTLRPLLSEESYNSSFEEPLGELIERGGVSTIPMTFLNTGSPLAGFTLLESKYGFKNDGTYLNPPTTVDQQKINMRYGRDLDETEQYNVFRENVAGFLRWIRENPDSGISAATLDEISSDPETLALYTSALTYGGYKQSDIYKDIKRRELINQGNTVLTGIKVIDESTNARSYYSTGEGATIANISTLNLPATIGGLDTSLLDNTYINLPTEVYDVLTPIVDWESPAGKEKIDEIKSAYHDILAQYLESTTESQQAVAQESYNRFRDELNRKYNIALSDNAVTAWDAIGEIESTLSARGLRGAGMEREAITKYLKRVRRKDVQLREEKLTQEESAERERLLKHGTPEEIQALSEEERQKLGLAPKVKINKEQWMADFKQQYPNEPLEYAETYYNMLYDKYGSYRSETFQNLIKNKFLVEEGVEFGTTFGGKKLTQFEQAYEKEAEKIKREEEDVLRKYKSTLAETKLAGKAPVPTKVPVIPTLTETPSHLKTATKAAEIGTGKIKETPTSDIFKEWTAGKADILGKDWEGYTAIPYPEYDTEEKQKQWQNIQAIKGTLYGLKSA